MKDNFWNDYEEKKKMLSHIINTQIYALTHISTPMTRPNYP